MPETLEQPVAEIPNTPTTTILPEFSKSLDKLFGEDGQLKTDSAPATPAEPPATAATPDPKATPAATAPKADAKTEEDWKEAEPPETVKTEQGKVSWRSREASFKKKLDALKNDLSKERDKAVGELTEARKNLEALQAKADRKDVKIDELPEYKALKAEHERATKELEEYSKQLRIAEVTRHPKFKAHFEGRINQAMEYAKRVGGDKAVELLKMPDSQWRTEQLNDLVTELGPVNGGLLVNTIAHLANVQSEREQAIAAEESNWKALKEQESVREQQKKESREKTFQEIWSEVTSKDKGLPLFQERDGDADWNKSVAERRALAQSIYEGALEPQDFARAAVWSASAPSLMQALKGEQEARATEVKALNEKIAGYEAEIAKLRAGTPRPGGDEHDTPSPPAEINGVRSMVDDMEKRGLFR